MPVIVFTTDRGIEANQGTANDLKGSGIEMHAVPQGSDGMIVLQDVLTVLGKAGIASLLVEGGARVHGAFYRQDLFDELLLFYAPFIIGDQGLPLVRGYELHHFVLASR